MFEKEAEEYLKKDGTKAEQILSLKHGKIKVKIKQLPFILAAFQQTYIDGAEFGYNKANEWHYVKDKLPEEDVYVYLLCKKDDYPVVARRHIFYGETEWKWDCKWGSGFQLKADNEKIIAWKEIVLPELKENK